MTTEHPHVLPCRRGCVRAGTEDNLPATHGAYCSRCWASINQALIQAPELAQHILANVAPGGSQEGERVDSSKEAPLPFNQSAFDDVSELYSLLVYWCNIWAGYLEVYAPAPAARAWRRDSGTVTGLPADFTPEDAHREVGRMTGWLRTRLDEILTLAPEDVDEFSEGIRDVWRMNARWPRVERPKYAPAPCPTCGTRVAIYPPAYAGDARRIVCEGEHAFTDEEFERIARDHATERAEAVKGSNVAAHLARKYLGRTA